MVWTHFESASEGGQLGVGIDVEGVQVLQALHQPAQASDILSSTLLSSNERVDNRRTDNLEIVHPRWFTRTQWH